MRGGIERMLTADKRRTVEEFLAYIQDGDDVIVPLGNGEPVRLLDALEEHAGRFRGVRIHQMHAMKTRPYIMGAYPGQLQHVAYFLSGATRQAFWEGKCELVPNHFHEVPRLLRETTKASIVIARAAPMDEHGYFSLGTQADYVASFIGEVPFFLEVNAHMPRTQGENQVHISQILGYIEHDMPLYEAKPIVPSATDERIADFVAERIEHESTLQVGIGGIPNAILPKLMHLRDLGIHTELLTDGMIDLVEAGVITGLAKNTYHGKMVGTFALGTQRLYDFIHENAGVELLPVHIVNDPREIAKEDRMVSINATTEVDFLGQCASETVGGRYYSSSGGQADFARGARFAKYGKGFICMHATTKNGEISRIRPRLSMGSAITTSKNDVDYVVTEFGVAALRGRSIRQRTEALIAIADPKFRSELTFDAKKLGYLI
ncbi:acetyl-CoA hydrolase/transferase family protein [Ectobacillus ponti]|uniref:Propionyl-CoA--succinate CoA transferase n=1 Tax=Ectobacillus ponti TaxID=2961894 RepID=A0AA41X7A5_9BACI|nr:acetyl-CoA hydrolase/transferase C-terminal domain-containing protein [Ectobacillus ponti]MCP8967635.1 propionyl-CoA--succinate CoA transferase [Ectobacillus ponti]